MGGVERIERVAPSALRGKWERETVQSDARCSLREKMGARTTWNCGVGARGFASCRVRFGERFHPTTKVLCFIPNDCVARTRFDRKSQTRFDSR